ncbi:MAG: type II toxin-antitoxin system VapC family toxin [Methylacidiphilales bacterium]|nr:type II toxin-antitoxin system VapC family toxin [Candidatus Methylacidiphilales bacterium]
MINAYFDSGVLVKNYCREAGSPEAIRLILAEAPPLPLTHFQEMEIRNALRLKFFRHEMTAQTLKGGLALLDEDIRQGRLQRPVYDPGSIFRRAEVLSRLHTPATGARTLDILHVAAALEIKAIRFISFDQRQRAMAKRAGLTIVPSTLASI